MAVADSSVVAILLAGTGGLAAAVGVLWRDSTARHNALEKRSESHLEVTTEQVKVLALLEAELSNARQDLNRIGSERTVQIDGLAAQLSALGDKAAAAHESDITQHGAQMAVLQTLQAILLQRNVDAMPPAVGETITPTGKAS